jgi:hypothetical protein
MGMDGLRILDLEDNQIADINNIEILNLCSGLKSLTLAGNPAAAIPNYIERVKELLPQLRYLDEQRIKPKRQLVQSSLAKPTVVQVEVPEIKVESHARDDEPVMTELLDDLIEDRPPTSRGFHGSSAFAKTPEKQKIPKSQKLIATSVPRIVRPMSAKGKPF